MRYSKLIAVILIAVLCISIRGEQAVFAASATVTLSSDKEEARIDDVVTVSVEIASDVVLGSFDGFVKYDSAKVEYITGPECVAGGEGLLKISDSGIGSDKSTRKYVLYFKAVAIGDATFAMRGTPEVCDSDEGYLMSVSTVGCTTKILPASKASNDAFLAQLKLSDGNMEPAFDGGIYEYSMEVAENVSSVLVSAKPHDEKAKVTIEGNTNLKDGNNDVIIIVTAEDGSTLTYTVRVNKLPKATPEPVEDSKDKAGETSTTEQGEYIPDNSEAGQNGWAFYAEKDGSRVFVVANARYEICTDETGVSIPNDYYPTSLIISGNPVTAYAQNNSSDPEYVLLILKKDGSSKGLYVYDRVEKTIQRYHPASDNGSLTREQELAMVEGYEKSLSSFTLIIVLMAIACAALMIIAVVMTVKANAKKKRRRAPKKN